MARKRRIHYTETDKAVMWDRWQKGDSLEKIAQLFDRTHGSVARILRQHAVELDDQLADLGDELDQPLEHLRLAGKMPIKRSLGHGQPRSQCSGGDSLSPWILQHLRKGLQDLQLALSGSGCHESLCTGIRRNRTRWNKRPGAGERAAIAPQPAKSHFITSQARHNCLMRRVSPYGLSV